MRKLKFFKDLFKRFYKDNPKKRSYYTVIKSDGSGNVIKTYDNIAEAANKLKISRKTVQRICRGEVENPKYFLKYGEKKLQDVVNYNNDRKW